MIVACSFSQIEKRGGVPSVLGFLTHSSPEPIGAAVYFERPRKNGQENRLQCKRDSKADVPQPSQNEENVQISTRAGKRSLA